MNLTETLNQKLWFDLQSAVPMTDLRTWTNGTTLFCGQGVESVNIEEMDSGTWMLQGTVRGGETRNSRYDTAVELVLSDTNKVINWTANCSCSAMSQCQHSVALLIKAAYQGRSLASNTQSATPLSKQELEDKRQLALAQAKERADKAAETQLL